ncbi:MAG: hypothetical protein QE271_11745 [Bacteriovoracaceae bacterium]|nr:hypothetical protein [Bacteriovoracaceae bacterium]
MNILRKTFFIGCLVWCAFGLNFAKADDCYLSTYNEDQFGEFVSCFNKVKNEKKFKTILNHTVYYYYQPGAMGIILSVTAKEYSSIDETLRSGVQQTLNLKSEKTEVINALVNFDCEGYAVDSNPQDYFTKGLLWSYRPVVGERMKNVEALKEFFASVNDEANVSDFQSMTDQLSNYLPLKQAQLIDPANNMQYDFIYSNKSKTWKLFYIERNECSA